jgi:hypothetical protein
MTPILHVLTAPKCQVGAEALAALPATTSAQITETIGGTEGGTLTLPRDIARAAQIDAGRIVRGIIPRRGVREWVVLSVADADPGNSVTVSLAPLRQLLALRGYARTVSESGVSLAFTELTGTVSDLLQRTVLTNLAADGLEWLSVGTVEYPSTLTLPSFSVQTRGQVLATIEQLTGYEVVLRRVGNDTGYAIDVLQRQNANVAPWLVEAPASALAISRTRNLMESATAVLGVGEDNAPLGDVQWIGGTPIGSGPFWLPLTDPLSGPLPIREDGQFVGAVLALPDDTTLPVLASRASDSAVQVASLGTYVIGQRVILREATGGPVSLITSPSALAQARGLVVARVSTRGARQERNLIRNGGFETAGLASWAAVGSPVNAEIPRTELGITTTGRLATARPAATGTDMPLSVKDFPAGYWFRRGHQLVVAGVTLPLTADVIPDTSGAFTLALGGAGLPGSYPDNTPFTLIRREMRTLTLDGDQNALSQVLRFRDVNTDGLIEGGGVSLASAVGEYTVTSGAAYVDRPLLAGRLSVPVTDSVGNQVLAWPTKGTDVYWLLSPHLSGVGLSAGQITFSGTSSLSPVVGTVVSYLGQNGTVAYVRVTAVSPGALNIVPVGEASLIKGWSGLGLFLACNVIIADGSSWTFTAVRETRTIRANGTQPAGALTLSCKPQSNIATRNWTAADTISMTRALSASLAITSIDVTNGFEDEFGNPIIGMQAVVSFNAASSTIDDLTFGTDWAMGDVFFDLGTGTPWRLDSITGTQAVLANGDIWITATPFTTPQTASASWTKTDTYALTGTASWGTNGRVTLTLASAIPAGRSYARGLPVGSNWVSGFLRLHAARSGGNTTVELFGHDGFTATSDPSSSLRGALYRITASGSTVPIPGETLDCAADVQVSGGGTASVTLRAANTTALAVDAVLTVAVPQLLDDNDRRMGSVLRLLFAAGSTTPANSIAAQQSSSELVTVPQNGKVTVTARAWFAVTAESLAAGQAPVLAIVDPDSNTMLAYGAPSGTLDARETPTEVVLTAQVELTQSRRVALRVFGGSSTVFSRWHALKEAILSITRKGDVPYDREGLSRVAWHRCQDVLALRKGAARFTVRGVDRLALSDAGTPPLLGQPIRLRSDALGLDTTERIVRLVWRWPGAELVEIEAGQLTPRFTDVSVTL